MPTIEVSDFKPILVIYHAPPCNDGWTAALIAWHVLGDTAEYVPMHYQSDPPDPTGRQVLMFDFSMKREAMQEFAARADSIAVYDHHQSAQEELVGLAYASFNMDKCGARMALEHFQAMLLGTEDEGVLDHLETLVAYVEDRDLWRWQLPLSKEVSQVLATTTKDFRTWQDLAWQVRQVRHYAEHREAVAAGLARSHMEKPPMVVAGEAMIRKLDSDVSFLARKAQVMEFNGHRVAVVNAPIFQSEVAGHLATAPGIDYGMAWWHGGSDSQYHYSLRSRGDGGVEGAAQVDVAKVAEQFGGGGHKAASGFSNHLPPWRLDREGDEAELEPMPEYMRRMVPEE